MPNERSRAARRTYPSDRNSRCQSSSVICRCAALVEDGQDGAGFIVDEAVHSAAVHHRAEGALLAATKTDRAVLMKLGIATPHLHLHIYPVSAALGRDEVFEIIEARVRAAYDEALVAEVRERLAS